MATTVRAVSAETLRVETISDDTGSGAATGRTWRNSGSSLWVICTRLPPSEETWMFFSVLETSSAARAGIERHNTAIDRAISTAAICKARRLTIPAGCFLHSESISPPPL